MLRPQLDSQIQTGNVTITNQYGSLRGGYEFFREGARRAYAGHGRLAPDNFLVDLIPAPKARRVGGTPWQWCRPTSRLLEHVLIGCLPFTSFDPTTEDLVSVIEDPLKKKMKRVMNTDNDPEAMRQFNALRDIVDRFRNTYSHGAFGHGAKAAMFVQVPDVGAVP